MPCTMKQRTEVKKITLNDIIDDIRKSANQTAAHSVIEDSVPQRVSLNVQGSILYSLDKTPAEILSVKAIPSGDAAQLRLELF